jgi:Bacterial Alpha-2-macroglobulin MG10 domain/Alpha-2-macroglobulin family/MG2 domain
MNKLKIFTLLAIILFSIKSKAQMKDYKTEWSNVEKVLKKGLTKTADAEARKVFDAAIAENNTPQIIKASMHLVGFRTTLVEQSELNNHFFFDTLILQSKTPAKNILQSMQAQLLYNYFQQNRWRFYNRTEQVDEKATDIQTWSIGKLHKTISDLYQKSLQNASTLQSIPTATFEPIILEGENTEKLRPSIYDVLAFRALDYFSSTETSVNNPSYKFTIEQPEAFANASNFIKYSFKTKDTAAVHFKALKIYQELLTFHIKDNNVEALIDADVLRINFVHQHTTLINKNELYSEALQNIVTKYPNNIQTTQAQYLLANELINNYKEDAKNKDNYGKAKAICEALIAKYPKSEGGINAYNLLKNINEKKIQFTVELVNIPNEAFRSLITYKNVENVYFRIIKTTKEEIEKLNKIDYDKQWLAYTNLKLLKNFTTELPKTNDYQEHKVEIKIDALDNGMYILLASTNPNFSTSNNILVKDIFHVSNISLINNDTEYHVLHRNTGQPLANAIVQTREFYYDYNTRNNVDKLGKKYTTDANGYFKTDQNTNNESRELRFEITYEKDRLNLLNGFYNYNYYNEQEPNKKDRAFLFTDRSIYRPGQTLYFKGIVINEKQKPYKATVVAYKKVKLFLMDANYQKVENIELTTNEYGSYNGAITLPNAGLTGQFYLQDSTHQTQQYFKVEEYKRPKFNVEIKQLKGSYRVNDTVKITGTAKAYAGNNIDGAKVKYRVVRKIQYPIWWDYGFYRGGRGKYNTYNRGSEQMEITNGETITDAKGEFKVNFKAMPDASVEKESQPTYYYEVNADITDINGETRTGNISVPVSYQALQLQIETIDKLDIDSFKNIVIKSTNINGQFEAATVKVTITALDAPKTYLRNRYWETPDQFIMTEEEFKKTFPLDIYKNEDQKSSWKKLAEVYNQNYTTKEEEKLETKNLKLNAGHYIIEVEGKDKYGETVTAKQFIELTDKTLTKDFKEAISITSKQVILQPTEKLFYSVTTSFDNVFAIHEQKYMVTKEKRMYEQLLFGVKTYTFDVNETDRGGISATVGFVKYNRIFGTANQFAVPWSNKELQISFATFRDKTLPGSQEEYSVKISGAKGEKMGAEMLATMYDASLDAITPHQLTPMNLYPYLYSNNQWLGTSNFQQVNSEANNFYVNENKYYQKAYDIIGLKPIEKKKRWGSIFRSKGVEPLWWLNPLDYTYGELPKRTYSNSRKAEGEMMMKSAPAPMSEGLEGKVSGLRIDDTNGKFLNVKKDTDGDGVPDLKDKELISSRGAKVNLDGVEIPLIQPRKNFNETAFFLPDLKTDAEGNIIIKYTIPEALTEWKLMAMAHTKDLAIGTATKKVITQKPLMVQPNLPRFLREGDKLELAVKIVNLSDKEITGTSQLELLDATTNQSVDGWFKNMYANQYFTVPAGQSVPVVLNIEIPFNYLKPLIIRTSASTTNKSGVSQIPPSGGGGASDGEENIVPVVTNRILVTETMPLPMNGIGTRKFKFEKLLKSGSSTSLSNQGLTVEYTSNPAWYAVQALPYLMEYPYECAEQTFNRYYANALASKVANSNPKIKAVFDKWAATDSKELVSNLSKNEELKSALLTETPWVMDAQNETQQKKNIALLFDLNKMATQLKTTIQKLKEMQSSNGGFVWFKGGRDDRYITQYILTGIGHLKKLGVLNSNDGINEIVNKALPYLDARMQEDYDKLIKTYKSASKIPPSGGLGAFQIQYLYMRSFFTENNLNNKYETAFNYFLSQTEKYWLPQSKFMQAMSALILHRNNKTSTAKDIVKSLKENAIVNEELGMYWKDIVGGYYWHQAPIETMSLMVETFSEVGTNKEDVDALRTWLIKNKQTNNWKTTKATAEACYAFLYSPLNPQGGSLGTNFLNDDFDVKIELGSIVKIFSNNEKVVYTTPNAVSQIPPSGGGGAVEDGTGYFKKRIEGDKVKPEMGNITITKSLKNNLGATQTPPLGGGGASSWGGVYWQYFEDLDKITASETPLKLQKKIFKETLTDKGKQLIAIKDNDAMVVGDKMIIRIELRVDRDMEYIHMKDMRSSGTEPINVLSQYKYQDGLGYYESTKDASTNFFFNYLPKGTYVFEYPLFVTHKGNFSNGVTTIQCMYAPEFTSHSEGVRVKVEAP